eukprot:gene1522-1683_t
MQSMKTNSKPGWNHFHKDIFEVTPIHVSFEDRSQLVKDLALHLCLSTCSDEVQEVRKGMEKLGVLQGLEQRFDESKEEFCVPSKGKASNVISLFKTLEKSEPKDQSSGQCEQEKDIIYNFPNFLESPKHDGSLTFPLLVIEDDGSVLETTQEVMLQEVTSFALVHDLPLHQWKAKEQFALITQENMALLLSICVALC